MKIQISEVIKTSNALSHADGLILYQYIVHNVKDKDYTISFDEIERISTAFLNASLGKLILNNKFKPTNIDYPSAKLLVKKKINNVVTNANNYVSYNKSIDEATSC